MRRCRLQARSPILVGVKELKYLVKQVLKEEFGDALENVSILRLVQDRSVLILVKHVKVVM